MALAPFVGALVAVPAAVVAVLARAAGAGPLVAAGLAVAALASASGGLHLDGLADTVDGVAGGRGDRERSLEIMSPGLSGAAGRGGARARPRRAGGRSRAVPRAVRRHELGRVGCAAPSRSRRPPGARCCRCSARAACRRLARAVSAAAVAGSVPRPLALAALLVVATLAMLAAAWAPVPASPQRAAVAVVAGAVGGALLAGRAARALGGITGDVLGAGVEYGVTAALVAPRHGLKAGAGQAGRDVDERRLDHAAPRGRPRTSTTTSSPSPTEGVEQGERDALPQGRRERARRRDAPTVAVGEPGSAGRGMPRPAPAGPTAGASAPPLALRQQDLTAPERRLRPADRPARPGPGPG